MAIFNNALAGAAGQAGGAGGYQIERSVRFNDDDGASLTRTFSSGNTGVWTWSFWVKRSSSFTVSQALFSAPGYVIFGFEATGELRYQVAGGSSIKTAAVYEDPNAWYHITLVADSGLATADQVKLYVNGEQVTDFISSTFSGPGSFINSAVEHSIGKYSTSSRHLDGYLADIHFIDGQALAATDFGEFDDNGVWQPIEYTGTYGTNGFHLDFSNNSSASALGTDSSGNGNDWTAVGFAVNNSDQVYSSGASYEGNAVLFSNEPAGAFGKPGISDWGVTYSPSGSTSPTSGGKVTFPSAITNVSSVVISYRVSGGSGSVYINDNSTGVIGLNSTSSVEVDVTAALTGSSTPNTFSSIVFGPSSASYGMRLNYIKVNGDILNDSTYNYLNDSLLDSPTNGTQTDTGAGGEVSGNYCTINAIHSTATLLNGNLDVQVAASGHSNNYGTVGMSSGKWYWEVYRDTFNANTGTIGFHGSASANKKIGATWPAPASNADQHVFYFNATTSGILYNGQSGASFSFSGTSTPTLPTNWNTAGGYWMFCVDMDNHKAWIGKDGVWWGWTGSAYTTTGGDPANGLNPTFALNANDTYFPFNGAYDTAAGQYTYKHNFGQRPFAYSAPSGYKALCTANLDDPTIADGSDHFDIATYGGGASSYTISGLSFGPDLVWSKRRDSAARPALVDTVRGATIQLSSDRTSGDLTISDGLEQFNSDGYVVGTDAGEYGWNGGVSSTFVNWIWNAGTSTVSNTDGTITASVRANPSAGFSIVSYTGDGAASGTIGHGLNAAPEMIIVKNRDVSDEGRVYHVGTDATSPEDYFLTLFSTTNGTATRSNVGAVWNDTAPTESVFSVGTEDNVNASAEDYIAYCWTPVEGYSAFGSYTGNNLDDGPFVYTGFRPAFIMYKRADSTGNWHIDDYQRDGYNFANKNLYPNLNSIESTGSFIDIFSNGFKLRTTSADRNASSGTHIYAAFAENPFKTARAR